MPTESGIDAGQRSYAVFKDRWRWDGALLNSISLDWSVKVKQFSMGKKKKEKRKEKREQDLRTCDEYSGFRTISRGRSPREIVQLRKS